MLSLIWEPLISVTMTFIGQFSNRGLSVEVFPHVNDDNWLALRVKTSIYALSLCT